MTIKAYVHVTAEPEGFPENVVLKYREVDRETEKFTGRQFNLLPEPWSAIRQRFLILPKDWEEIEGYLRENTAAYMGLQEITFDVVEDDPR